MMESHKLTSTAPGEADINRSTESWVQLPAENDRSQFTEQMSVNPLEGQPPQSVTMTTDWEQLGEGTCSLQLDFQDSRLSPALSLLPSHSGKPHNFSEYSLFQQTDLEFAPLRGSPDISVASERFLIPPQGRSAVQPSDYASLSQHPLAHTTILSDEGASSCCSLSQHSMSPGDGVGRAEEEKANNRNKTSHSGVGMGSREKDDHLQTPTYLPVKSPGVLPADDTSFLSGGIPAHKLLELLQKDVGMPSGSSSAVSSASDTSLNSASSFRESKSGNVSKPATGQVTGRRECPQGGASVPAQKKTENLKRKQSSQTSFDEISNITVRSHSTQPDDTTETLYRQLCAEIESSRHSEPGPAEPQREATTRPIIPDSQTATPDIFLTSKGKVSSRGVCGTGPWFSAGVERGHRERDLWSSGNLTGIDGSFLGLLSQPVSQSTPGVIRAPVKSSAKPTLSRLSAVESNLEASRRSSSRNSSQPAVFTMPNIDFATDHPDSPQPVIETLHESSGKVRSLPSLNYLQKVDAWRANQSSSSSKTSLFDNLALQGFSGGVSPKQKAVDAVSDSLNRMLTPQGSDNLQLQTPGVPGETNQIPQQNLRIPGSSGSSSPTRGDAVGGGAPHEKDDAGAGGGGPLPSPLGRSQSYSSLNTVVTSIQPVQQAHRKHFEQESSSQTQEERSAPGHFSLETEKGADGAEAGNRPSHKQQSATVLPSALMSLGRFSDVSSTQDTSGILSQDSDHIGQNFGASVGASSVVSLEVDNYAPYWNAKPFSPPKGRELNIEDRIPMYLHNLGIDQSPSTILTPFAPRGPIREPEFSPTDLCTITTGTPTKSTPPSEGDSPPKGEFSRSSLLSVGSSMSIPLSVDSLHPIMPFPDRGTKASPSPDRPPRISAGPLNTSVDRPEPQDPHPPPAAPDAAEHQQEDSSGVSTQEAMELVERFASSADSLLRSTGALGERDRAPEPPCSVQSNEDDSFVGSKTLQDIRRLLGRAENIVSGGSSLASSSASSSSSRGGSQLHSDDDGVLFSLRRRRRMEEGFQDSSFTSSSSAAAADPRSHSHSSLLWARSSSDSLLTSDRLWESSAVRLSREPGHQSAQALSVAPHTKEFYTRPLGGTAGRSAGSGLLAKSVRRAEPEGCSAVPSDATAGVGGVLQNQQASAEAAGNTGGDPAESRSSSSCTPTDSEQGAVSDVGSSESSLAARVAQLLQNESPVTVVSSRASTADLQESRAREWIKLEVSGQQCEPLELNVEDRRRIEAIKRELLLHTRHPVQSQGSTDTESSAVSSLGYPGDQPASQPVQQQFRALRAAEDRLSVSHRSQQLSRNPFDPNVQLQPPLHLDLEAQVREIALREGLALPAAHPPPPLTSITITTCRRSPTPVPPPLLSSSPTPPEPPPQVAPRLPTDGVTHPTVQGQLPQTTQERDGGPVSTQRTTFSRGPASVVSESEPNSSLSDARGDLNQDTADSQSELELGVQPRQEGPGTPPYDLLPRHGSLESIERGEDVRNMQQAQWRSQPDVNTDLQRESDRFTANLLNPGGASLPLTSSRYRQQISGSNPDTGRPPRSSVGQGAADPVSFSDSSTLSPSTKTGHIAHLHLTLSPKGPQDRAERAAGQASDAPSSSRHAVAGRGLQAREFAPLRHSSVTSSVEESLGYAPEPARAYQARSHDTQEPIRDRRQCPGTADASVQFSTTRVPEGGKTTWKFPQSFTPPQSLNAPSRPLAVRTPALPVLLPYKPHGSEELFYVPQVEAQLSPIRSDTTMESSHPGSDDAVPPRFNTEVLGSRDREVGRGVTIKHTEGIYSKRVTHSFSMQTEQRGTYVSADASSQVSDRRPPPHPYSQGRASLTRAPLPNHREPAVPVRDQGTSTQELPDSPVQPSFSSSLGEEQEEFQPLRVEVDYSMVNHQRPSSRPPVHSSVPRAGVEREQERQGPGLPASASQPSDSSLDQLWRRFSERWSLENAGRPTSEREASLLDRLERLSRLIHGTGRSTPSEPENNIAEQQHPPQATEQESRGRRGAGKRKSTKEDERRRRGEVGGERSRKEKEAGGRRGGAKAGAPRQAWTTEAQTQAEGSQGREPLTVEEDSPVSLSSSTSQHLCPAEREDESGSGSGGTSMSSMSTVDTARLIRAFGAHRVRSLTTGTGLKKLYSAIDKQREEKEHRRGKGKAKEPPHSVPAADTTGTDDSTVTADSVSSTYTLPPHRGPSQAFTGKKAVKLVSKGIQAGDLEIVRNGTRRHTRDVGTTFPSPGSARGSRPLCASSSSSGGRSPPKAPQGFLRERKSKRSAPKKHYPQGVTWYVPADDLRALAKKENQPEAVLQPKPSQAWFEAYCGRRRWREPFRQCHVQVQEERLQTNTNDVITEPEPEPSVKVPAALVRMTLQEALELRRPDFVSQSRERMKRMALQVEERRLQAIFSRERDDLFNRPGGPGRLSRPAAPFKRAVPKKEMVQRSKQWSGQRSDCVSERVDRKSRLRSIYDQLPEVQKRREEERRKAEYGSYRLNAQHFNKKVVNRILGRRTPWQ